MAKRLDLTDVQSIRAFGKDVAASEERLDIVVCNAGRFPEAKLWSLVQALFSILNLECAIAHDPAKHAVACATLLPGGCR